MFRKSFLATILILISCSPPLPYSGTTVETDLRLQSGDSQLSFTYCRRKSPPRTGPGVIIIPAAPGDRNWNMGPVITNSGLLLARALADAGFFTLRFDPPGRGRSTLNSPLTPDKARGTIRTLHNWLRSRPECRGEKIFWIAHGESALTALLALKSVHPPDGIILLCPPGLSTAESLLRQVEDSLKRRNIPDQAVSGNLAFLRKSLKNLITGKGIPEDVPGTTESVRHTVRRLFDKKQAPFHRWTMGISPPSLAPPGYRLLIIFGEHDVQYPHANHTPPWRRAGFSRNIRIIPLMDYMLKVRSDNPSRDKPIEILKSYTDGKRPLSPSLVRTLTRFMQGKHQ